MVQRRPTWKELVYSRQDSNPGPLACQYCDHWATIRQQTTSGLSWFSYNTPLAVQTRGPGFDSQWLSVLLTFLFSVSKDHRTCICKILWELTEWIHSCFTGAVRIYSPGLGTLEGSLFSCSLYSSWNLLLWLTWPYMDITKYAEYNVSVRKISKGIISHQQLPYQKWALDSLLFQSYNCTKITANFTVFGVWYLFSWRVT